MMLICFINLKPLTPPNAHVKPNTFSVQKKTHRAKKNSHQKKTRRAKKTLTMQKKQSPKKDSLCKKRLTLQPAEVLSQQESPPSQYALAC